MPCLVLFSCAAPTRPSARHKPSTCFQLPGTYMPVLSSFAMHRWIDCLLVWSDKSLGVLRPPVSTSSGIDMAPRQRHVLTHAGAYFLLRDTYIYSASSPIDVLLLHDITISLIVHIFNRHSVLQPHPSMLHVRTSQPSVAFLSTWETLQTTYMPPIKSMT